MEFGSIALERATGVILAHTIRVGEVRFKKGRQLSHEDINALREAGCKAVVGARLQTGELGEDAAAQRIALALAGTHVRANAPYTGRCNLYSTVNGVLQIDTEHLDRLNLVDEAITVATLPPFAVVDQRQLLATIKIIPYGVAETMVAKVEAIANEVAALMQVAEFHARTVGLVQTQLPGIRTSVLDKTRNVVAARLQRLGSALAVEQRCAHDEAAIADELAKLDAAGCDLFLIAGASATADRRDVVPAGLESAGGRVLHMGMPVEPGNLLLLGEDSQERPVVCLPGCARSPALNGCDWILERLAAGIAVTREDIMRMGAGGLIKGRMATVHGGATTVVDDSKNVDAATPHAPRVAAIVLAAGQSTRMGARNKLLELINGEAMVARVIEQAVASQVESVTVVIGHEAERVRAIVKRFDVTFVDNPNYVDGLSTSLRAGITALGDGVDGVVVCLGDMPWICADDINRLLAAFSPEDGRDICAATHQSQRGNPVLWSRSFFDGIANVSGDSGARGLLQAYAEQVTEVETPNPGVLRDVDVPEALTANG